jgi:hypothetical protein
MGILGCRIVIRRQLPQPYKLSTFNRHCWPGCPASTTFSGQRQLFFPTGDDNYKLYECLTLG